MIAFDFIIRRHNGSSYGEPDADRQHVGDSNPGRDLGVGLEREEAGRQEPDEGPPGAQSPWRQLRRVRRRERRETSRPLLWERILQVRPSVSIIEVSLLVETVLIKLVLPQATQLGFHFTGKTVMLHLYV